MARYIDADKLSEMIQHKADTLIEGKEAFLYVAKWLELLPGADVVERSECEKWYHEYHVIKDALKQEKEYHRSTEKLADKYQVELDAMRGAANSYKMHYEEAKREADRLAVELEAEKTLRVVRIERIFEEIEKEGAIFEGAHETTCYFPNGFFAELKKKYLPGGDGDERQG